MENISIIGINLLLTLFIELTIACFLKVSKTDIKKIALINVLTNVPINIIVNIILRPICSNYILYPVIIILEFLVVIIEGTYFKKLNNSVIGAFKLAILLNVSSFGYGLIYKLLLIIIS